MSDEITYQGRRLGTLHSSQERGKYAFVVDSLDALKALLMLDPDDKLDMSGRAFRYGVFLHQILEKATIYTSPETYLANETAFPLGSRAPERIAVTADGTQGMRRGMR